MGKIIINGRAVYIINNKVVSEEEYYWRKEDYKSGNELYE